MAVTLGPGSLLQHSATRSKAMVKLQLSTYVAPNKYNTGTGSGHHHVVLNDHLLPMPTIISVLLLSTFLQVSPPDFLGIRSDLQRYQRSHIIEKVHLHTDRTTYSAGDTVWFKAYVVATEKNVPSLLSKYLYVQLLSADSVIRSMRLRLNSGLAPGDIPLPDTLSAGHYRIRAYTQWMRNAGPAFFYDKKFWISDKNGQGPAGKKAAGNNIISFFPEGGTLISGIPSVVAFKAIGPDGLSREFSGYIIDEHNDQVCTFRSQHAGMGSFSFIPYKGSKYTAMVSFADGQRTSTVLPDVASEGYSLAVSTRDTTKLTIQVYASPVLRAHGKLTLIAAGNGPAEYIGGITTDTAGLFTGTLLRKTLSSGVIRLTLFSDNRPVAERLVFINPVMRYGPVISTDKTVYHPGEKVTLTIRPTDTAAMGQSVLSIAVTRIDKGQAWESGNASIFSDLLLCPDIRGYVEKPDQYFDTSDQYRLQNLDLLMLTQGWRRYNWDSIANNNYHQVRYHPETGPMISGAVKLTDGKPVSGAKLIALPAKGPGLPIQTNADSSGRFTINLAGYPDTTSFMVQASAPKGKGKVYLTFDKPFEPIKKADDIPGPLMAAVQTNTADLPPPLSKGRALREVRIDQRRNKKYVPEHSFNLNGPGNADVIISQEDIRTAGGLENALIGMIPGFRKGAEGIGYQLRGGAMGPMRVFLDGILLDKPEYDLAGYSMTDIESVEVLNAAGDKTFIYGPYGRDGVILINTARSKAGPADKRVPPGIGYYLPAIYRADDFYIPAYNIKDNALQNRTTVFWTPQLVSPVIGQTSLPILTSRSGSYRIIAEGISVGGTLIHTEAKFKVGQ